MPSGGGRASRPTSIPKPARLIPALALLAACSPQAGDGAEQPVCTVLQASAPLPAELPESSGAAIGRREAELVWTLNDSGGDATLYAVRPTGALLGAVEVQGAENRDWEDLAAGPCPAGHCLFVADIGDNEARRDDVSIYRVPEPDPGARRTEAAERFRVRFPGGPRDAEGLAVLPSGELLVLSKGRNSNVAVYRYPLPLRADETVELEKVADLSPAERDLPRQVTAAGASPDGRWIAVRDYVSLAVYPTDALLRGDTAAARIFDLRGLDEPQGEAVALLDGGRAVLTSEGPGQNTPGQISVLSCDLGGR